MTSLYKVDEKSVTSKISSFSPSPSEPSSSSSPPAFPAALPSINLKN